MRDRDVPKPVLDRAGVDAVIGELVAAGMPQHVEMHRKRNARPLADDLDQPVDRIRREWRAALAGDDIAAVRVFLSKRRQHAEFVAADRMDGWLALLGPANMQRGRAAELDLRPLKLAGFLGAQAVAVGHDDEAGVPLSPAPVLGRLDQLLDSAGVKYSRLRRSALGCLIGMIRASMTWSVATCRFSSHGSTSFWRAIIRNFLGFRDQLTG